MNDDRLVIVALFVIVVASVIGGGLACWMLWRLL